MKLDWLIPGTIGTIFALSSPALATKLESWHFDANQNRLEINTNGYVQPQTQLIFGPTRLIIDLPKTTFGKSHLTQPVNKAIRAIRVGQFNPQTARLVVELSPGYTLNPKKVKFVGTTPSRWLVQLPKLTKINNTNTFSKNNVYNNAVTVNTSSDSEIIQGSKVLKNTSNEAEITRLLVTGDGFFVRTSGGRPKVEVNRSKDRKTITMDIYSARISPSFSPRTIQVNKHGVETIQVEQLKNSSSLVRMTLRVDKSSPDWQASSDYIGGLVILPGRMVHNLTSSNSAKKLTNTQKAKYTLGSHPIIHNAISTIKSIELTNDGSQLLIHGDHPLSASSSGWDRKTALFRIEISNAKLSANVKKTKLNANSPVLRVRQQQQNPNTVVIFIQPASGVRMGTLNQMGKLLSLKIQRYSNSISSNNNPIVGLPSLPFPNPRPVPNILVSGNILQSIPIKKGKLVVIIDPGHGGKDSGAIGIGGLQEKQVILPISKRVTEILQQNGIQVIMTRRSDYFVTLPGRVKIAEQASADLFVSIHANSAGMNRPEVSGLETYYYNTGLELAQYVHNRVLKTIKMKDRRIRKARFYVLRKNSIPSILVETGFLTGQADAKNLKSPWFQNKMAEGIARGILDYIKQSQ
ncbi:N-acetylmuramoyl-L-alanine amidase [Richelia intracellularis HH01]|uniref:N-acetylmuramoyl-L-alanine amidase n=1 Tax=Richelia intracellularis HH01 TaxID=1165094 RepID=M1WTS5_9NOST|nr:N-acetylmuramoyl-L-alanine amidase [Richelia intracellularis]CCH68339.1 N-acetylmuramoyl-L-alanine amidase [Richelia intracellularis HH01]